MLGCNERNRVDASREPLVGFIFIYAIYSKVRNCGEWLPVVCQFPILDGVLPLGALSENKTHDRNHDARRSCDDRDLNGVVHKSRLYRRRNNVHTWAAMRGDRKM